ncbi:complement component C1q receptor-like [Ruditapes philippinarum]|uniref:complement component C1q receptor-like n=1 Tax=Ruditapes philippinarum TaxID=129788 RepID=UPI00295A8CE5|nr:complement component C1q receptor-like [Ruditapes philippinarum]
MGRKIRNMFFAVLAMFLISSAAGKVSETDCTDGTCTGIDHAECDENTKCKCSDGYEEDSTDGSTCVKRAVSETECNNGDECKDIEHAECEKDQTSPKCKCSDGYEEDSTDKNKCVKILGGTCSDNDGCLKVANAVCTGGKCACDTDFGEKDNVCIRTVSGTTCAENGDECDDIDNSHCDTDKCKCDAGYVMNVRACVAENAAASIQLGTLTVLLCALATLIQQF